LASAFVVVANTIPTDGGAAIVNGNERVLRARLSDARFFWCRDLDTKLEQLLLALSPMVFHAKLGSLTDRITRLEALARALAVDLDADGDAAARAARLCKADLATGTVGEFPELQGTVGQYLARAQGEDEAVAQAIGDHYAPSGPSDRCPTAPVAIAVALADKLDTLVGFFGINQKPTGSRDPFSLRRAALGVLRILVENRQSLSLTTHLGHACRAYTAPLGDAKATVSAVLGFMRDRFRVMLRDVGHRHDRVDAVLGHGVPFDNPLDVVIRLEALGVLLDQDDGKSLVATYKRAANILRIEDKKDGPHPGQVDAAMLSEAAEVALYDALVAVTVDVQGMLQRCDYAGAMARLADLRVPLDAFFGDITVNADDAAIRGNRLRLLAMVRDATVTVADFGALEG
jgi:glycyl-tRNA synthetase beta chain